MRERAPLRFSAFMGAALYDPQHGYYSRHIKTVGRGGDFSTTATLDPALGRAVASWLTARWGEGRAPRGHVIEVGAGDGALASDIRRALSWRARRALRYHIVERSEPLRVAQGERLGRHRCFRWQDELADALADLGGRALIVSNELVDAFPVVRLRWDANSREWRELLLHHEGGIWRERAGQAVQIPAGASLRADHDFADGQVIERHDAYFEWLGSWLPQWRRGDLLTIDYGGEWPELYHRRPNGTLRAYFAQMRFEAWHEVLSRPGRQDITADVDFTDLIGRGATLGLETVRLQSQRQFLAPSPNSTQSAGSDPLGAGQAFRVLHQRWQ